MKLALESPAAFGHWVIERDKLDCRLPRKTVTVRAPRKLLMEVLRLCDGSLSWSEVLAGLGRRWAASSVAAFMSQLVREGVLVEASQLWAHWSDLTQLPVAPRVATNAAKIAELHKLAESRLLPGEGIWDADLRSRSNGLAALFEQRESSATFGDDSVSVEALCSVLWAAHGVARPSRADGLNWHRTVASGGNMHSARWFVVVLRELPAKQAGRQPVPPGVYETRFHEDGGASLEPTGKPSEDAWRSLRDPRVLRFASALVLPVYDVGVPARKLGNQATLFATIEAGQCLQNAQLMATALGSAVTLRGDTVAKEVLALAGLEQDGPSHWLALPGMVLGAKPTATERAQQASDNWLKITPNLQPRIQALSRPESFAFAATPMEATHKVSPAGSGRGTDPRLTMTKAEAEAWERLGWATPSRLIEGRHTELAEPVSPHELVAYSRRQYAATGFACTPYSTRRRYLWKEATNVASGRGQAVLAECVYARASLPPRSQSLAYTNASTSGVAAGRTFEDALARGTLELIERDAFVCSWLAGRPRAEVEPRSLPGPIAQRVDELGAIGVRIAVLDISTTWSPVIAVFLQAPGLPFTAITAAAAFSAEEALLKALDEAEGRLAYAQNFAPTPAGAGDVMQEIERYYRQARTYRRSDFYALSTQTVPFSGVGRKLPRHWADLKGRILSDGFELLGVDITPEHAAIDQGRTPLYVVRAFVPIWFQRGMQPEGMPRFVKSASGSKGRPAGFFVHPFT